MGWFFGLCVECSSKSETEAVSEHFETLTLSLSDGRTFNSRTFVYQIPEISLIDWWFNLIPIGISESGICTIEDACEMTELGILLYKHLQKSPYFRYALVGLEVDEFRYYHELVSSWTILKLTV